MMECVRAHRALMLLGVAYVAAVWLYLALTQLGMLGSGLAFLSGNSVDGEIVIEPSTGGTPDRASAASRVAVTTMT